MNKETWKDVIGYAGLYQVQEVTIHGYCRVRLFDAEGNAKHYAGHRLVMNAFVEILDEDINHINEIKTDNRLANSAHDSRLNQRPA